MGTSAGFMLLIIPFNFHSLYIHIGKCKFATGGHTAETTSPPTIADAAEIGYIPYGKPQCCPTNATSTNGAVCDNIANAGNLYTHEHTTDPEYERLD